MDRDEYRDLTVQLLPDVTEDEFEQLWQGFCRERYRKRLH